MHRQHSSEGCVLVLRSEEKGKRKGKQTAMATIDDELQVLLVQRVLRVHLPSIPDLCILIQQKPSSPPTLGTRSSRSNMAVSPLIANSLFAYKV